MKPESMLDEKKAIALDPKDVASVKGGSSAEDEVTYYGGTLDEIIVTPPAKREQ